MTALQLEVFRPCIPSKAQTQSVEVRDILVKQGRQVEMYELDGPLGHLNGIVDISQAADTIVRFLGESPERHSRPTQNRAFFTSSVGAIK